MIEKIKIAVYKLLKKSEKWTKTDMIYLAKGGFWLTLGQGISSLSSFLLAIAFANLLPKETYGTYKYIMSIVSLLAIPTLAGMNTAIIQAVARGYEGSVIPAFKTKVKWGLLGGLASLILAGYYYFQGNNVLAIAFLITAVFVPFMDSLNVYVSYLVGKKDFKKSQKYDILTKIISTILIIILIFFNKNIYLIILAYLSIHTTLRFIFFSKTIKNKDRNNDVDSETIRYGKKLTLIGIIETTSKYIDKLLLFHFFGSTSLAIYSMAIAPIEQMNGMIKKIGELILPKFSAKKENEIKKGLSQKIFLFLFIIIAIIILYFLISPYFYKIFLPQYIESIRYSQMYSIYTITIIAMIPLLLFKSQKRGRELFVLNILGAFIQVIMYVILIPKNGIMGIISAKIISSSIITIMSFLFMYKKDIKTSFSR